MLRLNTGWLFVALVLASIGFACSYSPHPKEGEQLCYNQRCVDGYVCGSDNHCYTPENLPLGPGLGGSGTGGAMPGFGGTTTVMVGRGGSGAGGVPVGTGGRAGSGGIVGVGGGLGAGGTTGMGGIMSTGGTTTPPNVGTVVTIANGQAQGAMTGYGWVAFGPLDVVTDPTCDSPAGQMVSGVSCDLPRWSTPTAYCMSGSIPAVPSAPTAADWSNNWGIQIGLNSTLQPGEGLGQSFSSVATTLTGSPLTGLRMMVHRVGDVDTTSYCAVVSSGVSISFTRFSTTCWDTTSPGTALTLADVPNIDKISIQVSSMVGTAITVTNLCLVGLTFGV